MLKRLPCVLVLVLAVGCKEETEPTVTPEERQAIEQLHNATVRPAGTDNGITYLAVEGATVPDVANNPVRVVRVKFVIGANKGTYDILYRFADGKPIQNRLNGSGDHWQPEAQVWVKGKP